MHLLCPAGKPCHRLRSPRTISRATPGFTLCKNLPGTRSSRMRAGKYPNVAHAGPSCQLDALTPATGRTYQVHSISKPCQRHISFLLCNIVCAQLSRRSACARMRATLPSLPISRRHRPVPEILPPSLPVMYLRLLLPIIAQNVVRIPRATQVLRVMG